MVGGTHIVRVTCISDNLATIPAEPGECARSKAKHSKRPRADSATKRPVCVHMQGLIVRACRAIGGPWQKAWACMKVVRSICAQAPDTLCEQAGSLIWAEAGIKCDLGKVMGAVPREMLGKSNGLPNTTAGGASPTITANPMLKECIKQRCRKKRPLITVSGGLLQKCAHSNLRG